MRVCKIGVKNGTCFECNGTECCPTCKNDESKRPICPTCKGTGKCVFLQKRERAVH